MEDKPGRKGRGLRGFWDESLMAGLTCAHDRPFQRVDLGGGGGSWACLGPRTPGQRPGTSEFIGIERVAIRVL